MVYGRFLDAQPQPVSKAEKHEKSAMLARLMMSLLTWAFVQAPLGANDPVEATATDKDLSHWAFQRPVPVAVPQPVHAAWLRTPVDAFVLDRLEKAGLGPASVADRATLLRRVTFDLTGLPPTPEEVDRFLLDNSPDAYRNAVERLLAS